MNRSTPNSAGAPFWCKSRGAWHLSAYRLLREPGCVRFARRAVPPIVDGFWIVFPETTATAGVHISVRSDRLRGQPLHDLLYQPKMYDLALDVGMATLAALYAADVSQNPFTFFNLAYRPLKSLSVLLHEQCRSSPLLVHVQRQELARLVQGYILAPEPHKVLVHGDLQPSHLIVDPETSILGIIDLEALHVGKPAANFGQLFTGYHYADPSLGRMLYQRCRARFPNLFDRQFDDDLRAAVALRCYRHVQMARRQGNAELESKARGLLAAVLAGSSFAEICAEEEGR